MKREIIRVFIADDHDLIREGLKRIISFEKDMVIMGETNTGEKVIEIVEKNAPNVLLLDMNMPQMNGLDILRRMKESHKRVKIIMLTVEKNHSVIRDAIQTGVDGYVLKDSAGEQIIEAIHSVCAGDKYIDKSLVSFLFTNMKEKKIQQASVLDQLTKREVEVLYYISKGFSNKEIGDTLYLSEKTIKNYGTSLFRKLHISDRVHATLLALEEDVEAYYQMKYSDEK